VDGGWEGRFSLSYHKLAGLGPHWRRGLRQPLLTSRHQPLDYQRANEASGCAEADAFEQFRVVVHGNPPQDGATPDQYAP
jgi:hypothetical protein